VVRRVREQYPRWGRAKLTVLLQRDGLRVNGNPNFPRRGN